MGIPDLPQSSECKWADSISYHRSPTTLVDFSTVRFIFCDKEKVLGKSSVFHNLATALYTHYNDYYACYNISELTKNSAKIIFKVRHSL